MTIEHIVFDIGKVLIHWDPEIPFRHILPDEEERRWFLANVCTPEWNVEQDRGRPWPEAEALLIEQFPEHKETIRAYRQHWHEMVPHAYEPSVEALQRLVDGGHDVTMLTNFASDTFREAQKRFEFLTIARGVTVSGDVKMIKPDPGIYEHHVREFALVPSRTLFIDDSAANIKAAGEAGWQTIHLTDPSRINQHLAEFKL